MYSFELKKIIRNKKNILLTLIICFVVPLVSFMYVKNMEQKYFEKKEKAFIQIYNEINEKIRNDAMLKDSKNSEEIEELVSLTTLIEEIMSLKYSNNFVQQARQEKDFYKLLENYQKKYPTEFIANDELLRNNVIFKELSQKRLAEIANEVGTSAIYFLKYSLDIWYLYIGILFLILFLSDSWSNEIENQQIRLIKTQPMSLKTYYYKKFIINFSVFLVVFSLYLASSFILGYIFNGLGSLSYPIYIDSHHMISITKYIGMSIVINLLGVLFIMSVTELLSIILKNYYLTFLMSFLFIYVINLFSEKMFSPKNYYLFFIFNSKAVIQNYYSKLNYLLFYLIISMLILIIVIRKITLKILLKRG